METGNEARIVVRLRCSALGRYRRTLDETGVVTVTV